MPGLIPSAALTLVGLVAPAFGLGVAGCGRKLPPVPASTPSLRPLLAAAEYERPAWSPDGSPLLVLHGTADENIPHEIQLVRGLLPRRRQ